MEGQFRRPDTSGDNCFLFSRQASLRICPLLSREITFYITIIKVKITFWPEKNWDFASFYLLFVGISLSQQGQQDMTP